VYQTVRSSVDFLSFDQAQTFDVYFLNMQRHDLNTLIPQSDEMSLVSGSSFSHFLKWS